MGVIAIHVAVSLAGIGAGLVALAGMLVGKRLDGWTAVFLASSAATSASGFALAADRVLPSHIVGTLSLLVLGAGAYARYRQDLAGRWRAVYVVAAVLALYLNVFVAVVQSFLKVAALRALAPTQTEPPFVIAQAGMLALFAGLCVAAVVNFRPSDSASLQASRVAVSRM